MGSAAAMRDLGFGGIRPTRPQDENGDFRVLAQNIALEQRRRVLILVGRLDGAKGLPRMIEGHSGDIELRMMASVTKHVMTGIFEIKDEDTLCAAIDTLQEFGGYRATVVNVDGSIDAAYTI